MDAPGPGGLGGTFGGNPAACAAALAVIEEFADGHLLRRANELGAQFRQRALAWQKEYDFIGDVRGLGAMQAIEFTQPGATRQNRTQPQPKRSSNTASNTESSSSAPEPTTT